MKIKVDIPDEYANQSIMILAGMELVAFKSPFTNWKIKTVRCDNCGQCCMTLRSGDVPFPVDSEGKCSMLKNENGKWLCDAKYHKPFTCLGDPMKVNTPECCIEHKEVKA